MRAKILLLAGVFSLVACSSTPKKAEHPRSGIFRGLFTFGFFTPCGGGGPWFLAGELGPIYQETTDDPLRHPAPRYLELRGELRDRGHGSGDELVVSEILVMRPPSDKDCK
jgi:hypothetical protein